LRQAAPDINRHRHVAITKGVSHVIPPDDPTLQPQNPPPWAPRPCICPHCGHSHGAYTQQASTLLDCLTLASDALSEAKRLIEEEVLP
jgi:hypothetical protein